MHRSGTSVLTRTLNLLGCDVPATLMKANEFNQGGYWESVPVQLFNDRLLDSAGTNWRDWQEFYPDWLLSPKAGQFREEALALLGSEFGSSHLFVLKDPRLCRILPFWLSVFEEGDIQPLILSPIRNPLDVAASLARRNGFDPAFSTLFWLRNVLDAELASRNVPRFFTSFEGVKENWQSIARKAQAKLGIVWPCKPDAAASAIDAYIVDTLHHHRSAPEVLFKDPAVSGWLAETYRILSAWAASGESRADFATLDRIRAEFGTASPMLSQLIAAEQRATGKVKSTATELGQARDRLAKAEASLAGETQRAGLIEQELATTKNAIAEKDKRIAALANDLTHQTQAAEKARAEIAAKLKETEAARANEVQRSGRFVQELATAKNALAEKERQIAALSGELTIQAQAAEKARAETEVKLKEMETARAKETQRASRLEQDLALARNTLADKEKRLAALLNDLRHQTQAAEVAQASVIDLGGRLQQAESEKAGQSQRAGQFQRELGTTRNALVEHERRIAALTAELAYQTQLAEQAQSKLVDVTNRLQSAEDARADQAQQARQLEYELNAIKNTFNEKENQLAVLASELSLQAQSAERTAQANAAERQRTEALERLLQEREGQIANLAAGFEQRVRSLEGEINSHIRARDKIEAELAEALSRLAQTESALVQRRHEADETALDLAKAQAELKRMEVAVADKEKVISGLKEHVHLLMADFRERQNQIEALSRRAREQDPAVAQLKEQIKERDKAAAQLRQLVDEREKTIAQAKQQIGEREATAAQLREQIKERDKAVAQLREQVKERDKAAAQLKEQIDEREETAAQLKQLMEEREKTIAQVKRQIEERERTAAQLKGQIAERENTITQLQNKQKEHLDETVMLSRLVIERERQANAEAEKAKLVRQTAAKELGRTISALLDNRKWSLLPKRLRVKRQMELLDRLGLLDREWYLAHYHDVREAGMDPLRHYAEYGAREGREPNSKFEDPKA